jgi:hypothetical protein
MASFEQHLSASVVATGVMVTPLHSVGVLNIEQSFIILFIGSVGGLLPDIDSDSSKPLQIIFKIISIFSPLLVLLSLAKGLPMIQMVGVWLLFTLLLHMILFRFFISLTRHRGIFHSLPMGVLFGEMLSGYFYFWMGSSLTYSTIAGLFLFFGYVIHLLLDEIVSLNSSGLRVKRSLGSALKLFDIANWRGSILLYLLVAFGFYVIPFKSDIFVHLWHIYSSLKWY